MKSLKQMRDENGFMGEVMWQCEQLAQDNAKKRVAGYAVVHETKLRSQPVLSFHLLEADANWDCINKLTVALQYGRSDLVVVKAVQVGSPWNKDIIPCTTDDEIRAWNNVNTRNRRGE